MAHGQQVYGAFWGVFRQYGSDPPPTPTLSGKFNLIELTKLLKVGIGTHLYPKTPPPPFLFLEKFLDLSMKAFQLRKICFVLWISLHFRVI